MAKAKKKPVARRAGSKTPAKALPVVKPTPAKPSGPELRALRSVIYQVSNLPRAKAFYAAMLGRTPYFDQPFYVGFDVEGAELGLDPDVSNRGPGPGGAVAYWRVDDISASWEHAIASGGEPLEPPHDVGGPKVAVVSDPSGNYVGLIQTG
jgi:predicted enzyme related to lactoylglutathione lyase